MDHIELTERVPFAGDYDVIVAGGGVAGCAAALEAARHGKKTMLIEKSMVLGGLATLGVKRRATSLISNDELPR